MPELMVSNEEERGKEGVGKEEGGRSVHRSDEGEQKRDGSQVQWSINHEEVDNLWKELCGKMAEEVLEKDKVEEAKMGAYKGRGEPLEWRIVTSVERYQPRM